jgi:hypothetical protein
MLFIILQSIVYQWNDYIDGGSLRLPQCNLDYVVASHQLCRIPIFILNVQPQYQYIVHTEQFSFATYIDHL